MNTYKIKIRAWGSKGTVTVDVEQDGAGWRDAVRQLGRTPVADYPDWIVLSARKVRA